VAVIAGCFGTGMLAAWTPIAVRINNYAYDLMMKDFQPPETWSPQSVLVAIDEPTLNARGGRRRIRAILAEALEKIAAAKPLAVASDITLPDAGQTPEDQAEDQRLAAALRETPHLVLPCQLAGGKWEDPLPLFKDKAVALGHVHNETDREDGVSRQIPLEITAEGKRRWALSLEAFRVARGQPIIESPDDVQVGNLVIPAARGGEGRPMLIRFLKNGIPSIPVIELDQNLDKLRGKVVFIGATAMALANDRLLDPYGDNVPGVEVHAHAYETLARGRFLKPIGTLAQLSLCILIAAAMGLIFALRSGWQAHALGAVLLGMAHLTPLVFFRNDIVFPFFAPVSVAWLSWVGAFSFQHFFVRGQLLRSESETSRYRLAMQWVAHEMRTPLTAIQGSSEIMTRYNLPEQKRQQLSEMINAESKRMARMIQTFLDIERLADGQMELKREQFPALAVVEACMKRTQPLAERKQISLFLDSPVDGIITGDRELLEYAFYNLLTNAVKYSPADTEIHVLAEGHGHELRLAVRDQGIGMEPAELKSIFKKFYRTKRAEASGEVGTGIGLSIVEQIVTYHGGRMEVVSEPGKGSCFTMILSASENADKSPHAQTLDRRG
jgi:signal transduction histidine kinase